jgi:hypothetical protein
MSPVDRRRRERGRPPAGVTASIRPGVRVSIVDMTEDGAAIQASHALRPGSAVLLCLTEGGRRAFRRATVLRSSVMTLSPAAVIYRAGLRFDDAPPTPPAVANEPR